MDETRGDGARKRWGKLECAAKDVRSLVPKRTQHGGRSQSDLKSAEFPNKNRRRSLKARGLNSPTKGGEGRANKKKADKKRRIPLLLSLATHCHHSNGRLQSACLWATHKKRGEGCSNCKTNNLFRETRACGEWRGTVRVAGYGGRARGSSRRNADVGQRRNGRGFERVNALEVAGKHGSISLSRPENHALLMCLGACLTGWKVGGWRNSDSIEKGLWKETRAAWFLANFRAEISSRRSNRSDWRKSKCRVYRNFGSKVWGENARLERFNLPFIYTIIYVFPYRMKLRYYCVHAPRTPLLLIALETSFVIYLSFYVLLQLALCYYSIVIPTYYCVTLFFHYVSWVAFLFFSISLFFFLSQDANEKK